MKYLHPLSYLPIVLALLVLTGCGKSEPAVESEATKVEVSSDVDTTGESDSEDDAAETVTTPTVDPRKAAVDPRKAAVDAKVNELVTLSHENAKAANAQLRILFAAADENPRKYAALARHLAERIASGASADSAEYVRAYLIRADLRDHGVRASLFVDMATYACEFPNSDQPIQLYKSVSSQLITDGQSATALALLQHGIQHCKSHRDIKSLERQRRNTMQTMSLLGQTRPVSISRPFVPESKPAETDTNSDYRQLIGQRVSLTGETLDGSAVTDSQLRGEWVYVHFWATWCGACRANIPNVVTDHHQYGDRVRFVGVNMDADHEAARKFLKSTELSWPQIASDCDSGWDAPLAQSLGIKSIPTSLLIAPDGKVVEAGKSGEVGSRLGYHLDK